MKVCKKCKAALINDQWIPTRNIQDGYVYVLCPECEQADTIEYEASLMSMVVLETKTIKGNQKTAIQQIYAIEKQFQTTGLNGNIIYIDRRKDKIIVKTSHPLLAAQIGKKFHKLYRGKLIFSPNGIRGVLVEWIGNTDSSRPEKFNPVMQQAAA